MDGTRSLSTGSRCPEGPVAPSGHVSGTPVAARDGPCVHSRPPCCGWRAGGPMTGRRTVHVQDHPIIQQLLRDAAPRAASPLPARERAVELAVGAALAAAVVALAVAT